jgi:tetratricopeptide (TPR) repeat protein
MKAQIDRYNSSHGGGSAQTSNKGNATAGNDDDDNGDKTRKKSDKNMNNYRKIVIADDSEQERQYKSDYRGRVQDRNVNIKIEPMFAINYYEKENAVRSGVNYHKYIDDLNNSGVYPKRLQITNREAPLTEEQVKFHFALIDSHTSLIVSDGNNAKLWFARALDFYLVQDFSSAIDDLTKAIANDADFYPAYFMRALIRCKQIEYQRAEQASRSVDDAHGTNEISGVDYDAVMFDLNRTIEIAPDFVYGYYNRANIEAMLKDYRAAIVDYDKAIELKPEFADAYFNRGLTHIFLGNNRQGISDLSKAGELGIVSAYNVIKRFTEVSE